MNEAMQVSTLAILVVKGDVAEVDAVIEELNYAIMVWYKIPQDLDLHRLFLTLTEEVVDEFMRHGFFHQQLTIAAPPDNFYLALRPSWEISHSFEWMMALQAALSWTAIAIRWRDYFRQSVKLMEHLGQRLS